MLLNAGFGTPKNGLEEVIAKPVLHSIAQTDSPQAILRSIAPLWQDLEKLENSGAELNSLGVEEDDKAEEEIVTNDEGTEALEPLEPAMLVAKKHELN